MNYYPHHIGDFDKATRHLTRLERSIYRDLIDVYYDTEQLLTLDLPDLCRKIIATSNDEPTVVERMLNEFFTKTPEGWFHDRCQKEIGKYHAKAEQASRAGKASAAKRTFNGRSTDVPLTNNQNQNQQPKKEAKASKPAIAVPDWVPLENWQAFVQMRKAMRSVPFTEAAANGVLRELAKLAKNGLDPAMLLDNAVMNGWRTVYEPKGSLAKNSQESPWRKEQRERMQRDMPNIAARAPGESMSQPIFEIEVNDVTPRRLG